MLRGTGAREEADLLTFRVPDIAEALKGRGAVFLQEPCAIHTRPDGSQEWTAFFEDDEGRPLALHTMP